MRESLFYTNDGRGGIIRPERGHDGHRVGERGQGCAAGGVGVVPGMPLDQAQPVPQHRRRSAQNDGNDRPRAGVVPGMLDDEEEEEERERSWAGVVPGQLNHAAETWAGVVPEQLVQQAARDKTNWPSMGLDELEPIREDMAEEKAFWDGQADSLGDEIMVMDPNDPMYNYKQAERNRAFGIADELGRDMEELDVVVADKKMGRVAYDSADDAALAFLKQNQKTSQSSLKEYGAVIYEENGKYYLGDTRIGSRGGVEAIFFEAEGANLANYLALGAYTTGKVVGTVHTHPEAKNIPNHYECAFSKGELFDKVQQFGDNWLPGMRYLGAPNGVMYKSEDLGPNTIVDTSLPISQSCYTVNPNGIPQVVYPNP